MQDKIKIADLFLEKFMREEIMTKSEFQVSIDRIMDKHDAIIETKFHNMETKIEARYNWIIGIVVTSVIGVVGLMLKFMSMIPH